ncbi:MAG: FliO/MopB family protein [Phycisphaeraceae bacterium]
MRMLGHAMACAAEVAADSAPHSHAGLRPRPVLPMAMGVLCFCIAATTLATAVTPSLAQSQRDNGADLIQDRMQRLFGEQGKPTRDAASADPAQPTTPGTPGTPREPREAASSDLGSRRLPPPDGGEASSMTRELVSSSGSNPRGNRPLPGGANSDGGGSWLLSTMAALGVVIALVLAIRWVYTKLTGRPATMGGSRAVEALSRTAIAPKNHVVLLRVGRRVLVCNDSAHGMRTLAEVDDPEEVAELLESVTASRPHSSTGTFNALLARFHDPGSSVTTRDTIDFDEDPIFADEGRDRAEHEVDRTRDQLSQLLSRVRSAGASALGKGGGQ